MGDPRKKRKKYSKPSHPWQKDRIDEELVLLKEYGLKNKRELWKMNSLLRNFSKQAKKLIAATTTQAEIEKGQLLKKLNLVGLLKEGSSIEDALTINLKNILERRLQTQAYRKNLARSIRQARQFITHGQIMVNGKTVTAPSCLIKVNEESLIGFSPSSSLYSLDHPERSVAEKTEPKEKKPSEKEKPKKTKKKESKEKPKETKKDTKPGEKK